ncbi:MAG: hypothetical protein U1F71_16855 [Verrucomicrobiaceae bacterium]
MKRKLQAIAVLVIFGAAKLPLEERVTRDLRQMQMLEEPLRLGVGEDLGQAGLAASLGGLRGLAACIFQLRAHVEFTNVNWAKVDSLYKLVTRLQPRNPRYWEEASWHMAYNAASYYLYNQELKPALRGQLYHDHVKRGIAILEEGLQFLPDNPRLWQKLGDTHWGRTKDFKLAGDAYWNSFQHGGLNFSERFAAYAWAQSSDPESWKKGYAVLKRLYDEKKATPGLIEYLKLLEQNLHVPAERRIPDPAPGGQGTPGQPMPQR